MQVFKEMPLRAQRPAPPPPSARQPKKSNINAAFDNLTSSDANNNRQSTIFSKPTVIRPTIPKFSTRLKKKPPPRPAPPKNYQAAKRPADNVVSPPPDLLADLADIFAGPQQKSGPPRTSSNSFDLFSNQNVSSSVSSFHSAKQPVAFGQSSSQQPSFPFRPTKKYPAPVPSKSRLGGEMSLIDFDTPVGTAHLTPSDTLALASAVNRHKSLLDWDIESEKPASQASRHSAFDLLCGNSPLNHAVPTLGAQCAASTIKSQAAVYAQQQTLSQHRDTVIDWGTSVAKEQLSSREFSPPEPKFPPPPPPPTAAEDETEEWTHVPVLEVCQALYDFPAETPGDLELRVGDRIEVELKQSKDWWTGRCNGRRGIFPSNFVQTESSAELLEKPQDQTDASSGCFAKALHTFPAEQPTDLPFQEGDTVQVLYRINQDWLFGTCKGKEGQFPANFVTKIGATSQNVCCAMYSFQAENADELSFSEGDRIVVVDKSSGDWWKGRLESDPTRKVGLFPANFVELCS